MPAENRAVLALAAAVAAGAPPAAGQAPSLPPAVAAERLLASMSVREKAGQLFVSWILSRKDGQEGPRATMAQWIADLGLGGAVLSLGPVADAAGLVTELQAATKVPLLLGSDFEGGVAARLSGATALGNQMLVGATGLLRLARAMGEVTGAEATAIGVPWVLAPVLDVNNNAQNPIINVRSFGADPALVSRLGCAFAQGVRSAGAMPCGKHFPGHGDVSTDSHLALPTVPGDAARLAAVELLPFRAAVQQGLESVMTGHLAVPGLGEDPALPATLSRKILGDVLRGQLGFEGLVVTDALEMGGVKNAFAPGEVAVRALLAGADVLLMPPDPYVARDAVVAAVDAGRVPLARLDDAVRRILLAKARLHLLEPGPHGPAADWPARVNTDSARAVADEIAARGITLVRDPQGLVPLHGAGSWTVVDLTDEPSAAAGGDAAGDVVGAALVDELRSQRAQVAAACRANLDDGELAAATDTMRAATQLLIGLHVRVREFAGVLGLPPPVQRALAAIKPSTPVVFVSFGSPYLAQQLPPGASYLCVYAGGERIERAVARALTGASIGGRLPVSIPGVAAAGDGLSCYAGLEVGRGAPATEGLDAALAERVEHLLTDAVADGAFPGAVCLVARRGRLLAAVAAGHSSYGPAAPAVRIDTLWDLASLTKVCATLPAVLHLVAAGTLSLDDPVQQWLPEFTGTGKERVSLRHLLAHTSGLPATARYDRVLRGKDAIVAAVGKAELIAPPGERVLYSDLGLVLAMAVVEAAGSAPFEQQVQAAVWTPLGMSGACFDHRDRPPLPAPPTEESSERGGLVQGHVHDENAFAMGGVSGHAGMFATAGDVLRLGLCLLGGGRGVLPAPLVRAALQPQAAASSTRALGFELLVGEGWGGSNPPPGTFGQTGFTGTSLWCDPRDDLCVVLLSNRVHPTRANDRIGGVRRQLHDLVLAAIER